MWGIWVMIGAALLLLVGINLIVIAGVGRWIYNKGREAGLTTINEATMKKRDEIEQPSSCLNKAAEDEPLFVLRAKDPLSPALVEDWARQAELTGAHEPHKIAEARGAAQAMREWRTEHVGSNRQAAQAAAANRHEG